MELLVATDGSEEATTALRYAIDLVRATDGSLTVAHAVSPAILEGGGTAPVTGFADADSRLRTEPIDEAEERGERYLSNAAQIAESSDVPVTTELLYGEPSAAIADFGADFDTIVVGHRGRGERGAAYMGSVARSVVEQARVPVVVAR